MHRAVSLALLLGAASAVKADPITFADPGAYASVTLGNGRIEGPDAGYYKLMRMRSFEVRLGRDLWLDGHKDAAHATSILRFDVVHYNEGHPDNNHRDGFAGQFVYSHKLASWLTGEIGYGLYSSMNTTTINGVQYDSARRGSLSTAAVLFSPELIAPAHVRVAFNHAWMPDTFHSNSLQIGIGRHFTDPPVFNSEPKFSTVPTWIGAAWERAITNMSGTNGASGGSVELRRDWSAFADSLTYLHEGDDGKRVDRQGVAGQLWLVQPLWSKFTSSFGIGPYFAHNRYDDNQWRLHGLFTIRFELRPCNITGVFVCDRTKLFYSFSRVKTYAQMNDRDLHHVGLMVDLRQ